MLASGIHVFGLPEFAVFVNAFFNENLLKRREMQLFKQLVFAYFKFFFQQSQCVVNRVAQHIADSKKLRLVVFNNTTVGRYVYLTVGEGKKCI